MRGREVKSSRLKVIDPTIPLDALIIACEGQAREYNGESKFMRKMKNHCSSRAISPKRPRRLQDAKRGIHQGLLFQQGRFQ